MVRASASGPAGIRLLRDVLAALLAATLLAACSGQEPPREARILTAQPATATFADGHLAHYNLVPTLSLGDAVAREYQVERRDGTALLIVAMREAAADGERPARADAVRASIRDLSGRVQTVTLREVRTGDYVDHVGTVRTSRHDTLRVEVIADVAGSERKFSFERGF